MKVRIKSSDRMHSKPYHFFGEPIWWARIGSGKNAVWLNIGRARGDKHLDVEVDVPDGTCEIVIGCGPSGRHGVRERISVLEHAQDAVEATACDIQEPDDMPWEDYVNSKKHYSQPAVHEVGK